MKRFLQIHMLTSYPPSNLNRDDLGRPKTAQVGGTNRLRISSQSLKRAWRTSSVFQEELGSIAVDGRLGIRSKRIGEDVFNRLVEGGIDERKAIAWARSIAGCFGKLKSEKGELPGILHIEQLAFISPEERKAIFALADELVKTRKEPTKDQLQLLRQENSAADIALFGRMLADSPSFNIEAAAQVAHAFTVQKVAVEDDYFTAVDDLNQGIEDVGAGHLGDTEFASGIFYTYINIDRELLKANLSGADDAGLMHKTIRALIKAAATVAPTGKQNSFASRAYAHFIMAELGDQQPRSLALAFVNSIQGQDMLEKSIDALKTMHARMNKAYGACSDSVATMDVLNGEGSLQEILDFSVRE